MRILMVVFAAINIFSFFLMLDDKKKSRLSLKRTSEGTLLFAAICFGAAGIFAGMFVARHKTQKPLFLIGAPLALIQNLALLYLIYASIFGAGM